MKKRQKKCAKCDMKSPTISTLTFYIIVMIHHFMRKRRKSGYRAIQQKECNCKEKLEQIGEGCTFLVGARVELRRCKYDENLDLLTVSLFFRGVTFSYVHGGCRGDNPEFHQVFYHPLQIRHLPILLCRIHRLIDVIAVFLITLTSS